MKSACCFCLILALATPSCVSTRSENSTVQRFEYQQLQMGVPFRIVLYAPDPTAASSASAASFQRIKQLNDVMSDYDADSELSRLSRASGQGREVPVSDDLWRVLQRAQELAQGASRTQNAGGDPARSGASGGRLPARPAQCPTADGGVARARHAA